MPSRYGNEFRYEKKERKRREAEERAARYKADPASFGLRRRIKEGITPPREALADPRYNRNPRLVRWLEAR